jgi:hypothetical protein
VLFFQEARFVLWFWGIVWVRKKQQERRESEKRETKKIRARARGALAISYQLFKQLSARSYSTLLHTQHTLRSVASVHSSLMNTHSPLRFSFLSFQIKDEKQKKQKADPSSPSSLIDGPGLKKRHFIDYHCAPNTTHITTIHSPPLLTHRSLPSSSLAHSHSHFNSFATRRRRTLRSFICSLPRPQRRKPRRRARSSASCWRPHRSCPAGSP